MHEPTEEWLETRAERLEVYGKEWLDWEKLIDALLGQYGGWVHPSYFSNTAWYLGSKSVNMSVPDWTVLEMEFVKGVYPKELDAYKVLML